jgi:hypothetical protein
MRASGREDKTATDEEQEAASRFALLLDFDQGEGRCHRHLRPAARARCLPMPTRPIGRLRHSTIPKSMPSPWCRGAAARIPRETGSACGGAGRQYSAAGAPAESHARETRRRRLAFRRRGRDYRWPAAGPVDQLTCRAPSVPAEPLRAGGGLPGERSGRLLRLNEGAHRSGGNTDRHPAARTGNGRRELRTAGFHHGRVERRGSPGKTGTDRAHEPTHPGRLNEVSHMVFKSADRSWRRSRSGVAALLKADLFREGIDGEAVDWACNRMLARSEPRRILIVISDGCPNDAATGAPTMPFISTTTSRTWWRDASAKARWKSWGWASASTSAPFT